MPPEQTSYSMSASKQLIKEQSVVPRDSAEESSPTNSNLGLLLHLTPIQREEVRNLETPHGDFPHHLTTGVGLEPNAIPENSVYFSLPSRYEGVGGMTHKNETVALVIYFKSRDILGHNR